MFGYKFNKNIWKAERKMKKIRKNWRKISDDTEDLTVSVINAGGIIKNGIKKIFHIFKK